MVSFKTKRNTSRKIRKAIIYCVKNSEIPISTHEIKTEVGCGYSTALRHLNKLIPKFIVSKERVPNKSGRYDHANLWTYIPKSERPKDDNGN